MSTLTQSEALSIFEYRNGDLYWKPRLMTRNRPSTKANLKAGNKSGHGYLVININKQKYYAHQIIFLMFHGYIPQIVDHIDCDSLNNKIENLRHATKAENAYNSKIRKDNTSGVKGLVWNKRAKLRMARIYVQKKSINLGYFKDFEEAKMCIENARNAYHAQFANHGHGHIGV